MAGALGTDTLPEMLERTTLCVSGHEPGVPIHAGEVGFQETIQQHYTVGENNTTEQLVHLKTKLRDAPTHEFWNILMEGMTSISGAQYGFVVKRILVDDHDSTIEMPPIGEPGSCLMAVAYYYNDGREMKDMHRDIKYKAFGAPCHHMKHDKVFWIPNGLPHFIPNNPNDLPFPAEAYLGIPLFIEHKCFGHFGLMWTHKGSEDLRLSWAYLEMLLHSLEDVIRDRMLEGPSYAKAAEQKKAAKVIPAEAVPASQSLKPYARSLSHELRTPMQGVVGMLDVMYATVQESLEGQQDAVVRNVLKTLRENIEVVQDSSRRAVEAADNVVHAYDLNMQVPDTPIPPNDDDIMESTSTVSSNGPKPNLLPPSNNGLLKKGKRRRTSDALEVVGGPAPKQRHPRPSRSLPKGSMSPYTESLKTAVEESNHLTGRRGGISKASDEVETVLLQQEQAGPEVEEAAATPGLRHTRIRDLLHLIIHESLRVGGRPESAIAEDTDGGEIIEVRTRGPNGESQTKIIEWTVDSKIPEIILVDERDLAKLVSCVFLNAVKFTEEGKITLAAHLSSKARFVVINIADTGSGIPEAFQPYLFQPFSREDVSLTRQKEGLGLGLLVAKGLARKIGGEITCVRSNVDGPMRGSEFELRVPLHTSDSTSRAATPSRTPSPAYRTANDPHSPLKLRHDSISDRPLSPHSLAPLSGPRSPDPSHLTPLSPRSSVFQPAPPPIPIAPPTPAPTLRRPSTKTAPSFDRRLAEKHPLTFLVVEDNSINRKLLVNMLGKLGYSGIHEAHDGVEAVHQMSIDRPARGERPIDVILMDLWMPNMDGYEATQHILRSHRQQQQRRRSSAAQMAPPNPDPHPNSNSAGTNDDSDDRTRRKVTVLAVTADVTDSALERASEVGMEGWMQKPYKLLDLERLILEYCVGGAVLVQT